MTEIANGEYWINQVARWGVGESKEHAREVRATIAALRARVAELEADDTVEPCKVTIDELWKDIIIANNPDYGDWEYPGQAYRHIKAEFDDWKQRAQTAEAENGRLREALELLAETCEEHRVRYNEQSASIFGHAPSAQEYWSGRRDEAGHLRDKLQAALAAPAPETGEREQG